MATVAGQPRLIKRGSRYYVVAYDPQRRRTERRSLKTKDLAVAKQRFTHTLELMQGTEGSGLPLTVPAILEFYITNHVLVRCADTRRQEIAAEHLSAFFRATPLADVDIPMCRAYLAARRSGKVVSALAKFKGRRAVNSTIRRELAVLSAAAMHAKKWRLVKAEHMPSIELPRIDDPISAGPEGAKFFTREQIALLLFNATGEMRDIIKLAYYTGARRASIQNLTAGQIDLERGQINLATPGKIKTKKRQPVVPILAVYRDDLQRLIADASPDHRIFAGTSFYQKFYLLCLRLRFDHPHHPHMLRHSRATHLLQDGVAIYHVAALLGDTIKTVEANYGHHSVSDLRSKLE